MPTRCCSARGYSVDQIADIYEVDRDTVSRWLDHWEDRGGAGLQEQAGRGRPAILNEKEQQQAIQIVEQDPRSCKRSLLKIAAKTVQAAFTVARLDEPVYGGYFVLCRFSVF